MRSNGYHNNRDEEVLSASPIQLVQLLYGGALDAIASARRYLRAGDIRARSRAIAKAMAIVTELSLSLDHQAGGELSQRLAELYGYVETLLIEANTEQADRPLQAAEAVLSTLSEGWKTFRSTPAAPGARLEETRQMPAYQPLSCAC